MPNAILNNESGLLKLLALDKYLDKKSCYRNAIVEIMNAGYVTSKESSPGHPPVTVT